MGRPLGRELRLRGLKKGLRCVVGIGKIQKFVMLPLTPPSRPELETSQGVAGHAEGHRGMTDVLGVSAEGMSVTMAARGGAAAGGGARKGRVPSLLTVGLASKAGPMGVRAGGKKGWEEHSWHQARQTGNRFPEKLRNRGARGGASAGLCPPPPGCLPPKNGSQDRGSPPMTLAAKSVG